VSAYARPQRRCRHNRNYWQFGDYVGIGAGAHGKITDARAGQIVRTWQLREPRRYLGAVPKAGFERIVEPGDLPFEYMMNALRLTDGFIAGDFSRFTGVPWLAIASRMTRLEGRGLLTRSGQRWQASALGMRFLNDVLTDFLPERAERTPGVPLSTAALAAPVRYSQADSAGTANERITCETGQVAE